MGRGVSPDSSPLLLTSHPAAIPSKHTQKRSSRSLQGVSTATPSLNYRGGLLTVCTPCSVQQLLGSCEARVDSTVPYGAHTARLAANSSEPPRKPSVTSSLATPKLPGLFPPFLKDPPPTPVPANFLTSFPLCGSGITQARGLP